MGYKRLTNKYDNYYNCNAICKEQGSFLNKGCLTKGCGDCKHFEKILNRLGELEDKIENGTLIELPCITYNVKEGRYQIISSKKGRIFASKFYLTREQAEEKIKELQSKE